MFQVWYFYCDVMQLLASVGLQTIEDLAYVHVTETQWLQQLLEMMNTRNLMNDRIFWEAQCWVLLAVNVEK